MSITQALSNSTILLWVALTSLMPVWRMTDHTLDTSLSFHLLDLAVINSWLLYRRDCDSFGVSRQKQKDQLTFKNIEKPLLE